MLLLFLSASVQCDRTGCINFLLSFFSLFPFSPSLVWHWPQLVVCQPAMVLCSSSWAVATIFFFLCLILRVNAAVCIDGQSGVHNLIAEIPSSNIISFLLILGQHIQGILWLHGIRKCFQKRFRGYSIESLSIAWN